MSTTIYESDVENFVIELLQNQGYSYLSPEEQERERVSLSDVVLRARLEAAIDKLNPLIPQDARVQILHEVLNLPSQSLVESNEAFHQMLTDGVSVEYQKGEDAVGDNAWLIDFDNPLNNDLVFCNQFTVAAEQSRTVVDGNVTRRPDVVLFVNGLPLAVIELKNPVDEKATVQKAFNQLQNYKNAIPSLFCYNGVLVTSDGLDAKVGSLTARWSRFVEWRAVDGVKEDAGTTPQIETLVKGMLRPDVILDLIRHFTVFEKSMKGSSELTEGLISSPDGDSGAGGIKRVVTIKKIAAYHQYHAVNKAVESTIRASSDNSGAVREDPAAYGLPTIDAQPMGDRKAGIMWHTQGSGKSLSMLFYAGKLIVDSRMGNPTIVVITDRNDLDDQLFGTFASGKQLLRQEPSQADSRAHLKNLLKTAGGGIVFTTIQKFSPERCKEKFELLSGRKNIVVIADEAHRSQYGFKARTLEREDGAFTKYGFAKYVRDALPNASFVGFTATPIAKEDASTPAVFGNYIDVYDMQQAVEDGATVAIYYESRLAQVHLRDEERDKLDEEVDRIIEGQEFTATEKTKAKWARVEAIVGHRDRLKTVAQDVIEHFEARREVFEGKGMIVAMSRRIAVELYEEIVKLRPDWRHADKDKGSIKVVMTSSSSDPQSWQGHNTKRQDRRWFANRFKDPSDALKLVIVRDMWLTGFDAPCLHTMYIDKPMRGHNLMQAIARVNRVYKDKPGGLIVDYIGIASDLKRALADYTKSSGKGSPTFKQSQAIDVMMEKGEVVAQMFNGFDYKPYFSVDARGKMTIILQAQEHILALEDGKNRFTKQVSLLSKAFALSVPSREAMELKEEVGFFQAVKARLTKFEPVGGGKSDAEVETAIRQIIDKALVVEGVIDVFDAAGIKKPDISVLSDEFLDEVRGMERKNLALELLRKILSDEVKTRMKKNFIKGKRLSEMLDAAIRKYQSNLLTTAQIIEELIEIAKEIKASDERVKGFGLSEDEIAFYDALSMNDSAREVMGDKTLRKLAQELAQRVKAEASIDWTIKESVQANLRLIVKKVLRRYGYPPDEQKLATDNILKQAELFAEEWSS